MRTCGGDRLVDERRRRRPVGLVIARIQKATGHCWTIIFICPRPRSFTEVRTGDIPELLKRKLAMLVLADPGKFQVVTGTACPVDAEWGDCSPLRRPPVGSDRDPLLPVKLRKDDRELGGRCLDDAGPVGAFDENSPSPVLRSHGCAHSPPSTGPAVHRAVKKTWARLTDGTPLVTSQKFGAGWLVFVHTSANPTWSNSSLRAVRGMLQTLCAEPRCDGEDR